MPGRIHLGVLSADGQAGPRHRTSLDRWVSVASRRLDRLALRTPVYLDVETLLSQAEYCDIDVAQQAEVVETTVRKRTGGGRVGIKGLGVDASVGRDMAYQSTYTLAPCRRRP